MWGFRDVHLANQYSFPFKSSNKKRKAANGYGKKCYSFDFNAERTCKPVIFKVT